MYDKMSGKMTLVTVRSWTLITFERFVSRLMNFCMLYKILLMTELLPTVFTGIHFDWFPSVNRLYVPVKMTLVPKETIYTCSNPCHAE